MWKLLILTLAITCHFRSEAAISTVGYSSRGYRLKGSSDYGNDGYSDSQIYEVPTYNPAVSYDTPLGEAAPTYGAPPEYVPPAPPVATPTPIFHPKNKMSNTYFTVNINGISATSTSSSTPTSTHATTHTSDHASTPGVGAPPPAPAPVPEPGPPIPPEPMPEPEVAAPPPPVVAAPPMPVYSPSQGAAPITYGVGAGVPLNPYGVGAGVGAGAYGGVAGVVASGIPIGMGIPIDISGVVEGFLGESNVGAESLGPALPLGIDIDAPIIVGLTTMLGASSGGVHGHKHGHSTGSPCVTILSCPRGEYFNHDHCLCIHCGRHHVCPVGQQWNHGTCQCESLAECNIPCIGNNTTPPTRYLDRAACICRLCATAPSPGHCLAGYSWSVAHCACIRCPAGSCPAGGQCWPAGHFIHQCPTTNAAGQPLIWNQAICTCEVHGTTVSCPAGTCLFTNGRCYASSDVRFSTCLLGTTTNCMRCPVGQTFSRTTCACVVGTGAPVPIICHTGMCTRVIGGVTTCHHVTGCPAGHVWSSLPTHCGCIPTGTGAPPITCPANQYLLNGICYACPNICPTGQSFVAPNCVCVTTGTGAPPTTCPFGEVRNPTTGACNVIFCLNFCPQGQGFDGSCNCVSTGILGCPIGQTIFPGSTTCVFCPNFCPDGNNRRDTNCNCLSVGVGAGTPPTTCPSGKILVGGVCVCPTGHHWSGTHCIHTGTGIPICPAGQTWSHTLGRCIPGPHVCPAGHIWNGHACVPQGQGAPPSVCPGVLCPPNATLDTTFCVCICKTGCAAGQVQLPNCNCAGRCPTGTCPIPETGICYTSTDPLFTTGCQLLGQVWSPTQYTCVGQGAPPPGQCTSGTHCPNGQCCNRPAGQVSGTCIGTPRCLPGSQVDIHTCRCIPFGNPNTCSADSQCVAIGAVPSCCYYAIRADGSREPGVCVIRAVGPTPPRLGIQWQPSTCSFIPMGNPNSCSSNAQCTAVSGRPRCCYFATRSDGTREPGVCVDHISGPTPPRLGIQWQPSTCSFVALGAPGSCSSNSQCVGIGGRPTCCYYATTGGVGQCVDQTTGPTPPRVGIRWQSSTCSFIPFGNPFSCSIDQDCSNIPNTCCYYSADSGNFPGSGFCTNRVSGPNNGCPMGTVWSSSQCDCVVGPGICPATQCFSPETFQCVPNPGTCMPGGQWSSSQCMCIPETNPTVCPANQCYSPVTRRCVPNPGTCIPGQQWSSSQCQCVPFGNPTCTAHSHCSSTQCCDTSATPGLCKTRSTGSPGQCLIGTTWDSSLCRCRVVTNPSCLHAQTCPTGQVWNPNLCTCGPRCTPTTACRAGRHVDFTSPTCVCVADCPEPVPSPCSGATHHWSEVDCHCIQHCSPTPCPTGRSFNTRTCRCECMNTCATGRTLNQSNCMCE